jgi:hypothetical protein
MHHPGPRPSRPGTPWRPSTSVCSASAASRPPRLLRVCVDRVPCALCAAKRRTYSSRAEARKTRLGQGFVLVRTGAPPGIRTPNPRIKSGLLGCTERFACTNVSGMCPESKRCTEMRLVVVPRAVPRVLALPGDLPSPNVTDRWAATGRQSTAPATTTSTTRSSTWTPPSKSSPASSPRTWTKRPSCTARPAPR